MMAELEQARTLLRENQERLALVRRDQASGVGYADAECVRYHENCVLAALSWVWDAQQRASPMTAEVGDLMMMPDGTVTRIIAISRHTPTIPVPAYSGCGRAW